MNWNLIGHDWAVDMLSGQITRGSLSHAYLFTGPHGVGRRTTALRFAQALNCTKPPEPGAFCGECRACRQLALQEHPDLVTVEADSVGATLKVEQIRELHRFLSLAPYEASYRVALILRFEEAQRHAANALLKTLEEPSARVILMLTTESAEHVPETILSRCQVIRLRPLPVSDLETVLRETWHQSGSDARMLAHLSGGRPGIARRYIESPERLAERQAYTDDQLRLLPAGRVDRFKYAEEAAKDREGLQARLEAWGAFWRDVLLLSTESAAPLTHIDLETDLAALAARIQPATALQVLQNIEHTREKLNRNANIRLAAENLMLAMPRI